MAGAHVGVPSEGAGGRADLPARYEPVRRLGAGGGGEVWAVRDRVTSRVLALKVLSSDAGDAEVGALVQEAVALSGLEAGRHELSPSCSWCFPMTTRWRS